jgi:hypothetical protein
MLPEYDPKKIDLATVDGRMALLNHIVDKCVNGWIKETVTPAGFVETTEHSYSDAIRAIGLAHKMLEGAPVEQKPIIVQFVRGLPRQDDLVELASLEPTPEGLGDDDDAIDLIQDGDHGWI